MLLNLKTLIFYIKNKRPLQRKVEVLKKWDGTKLMLHRSSRHSDSWSQVQFLLSDTRGSREAEMLHQSHEEEEQLHPHQAFPHTDSETWKHQIRGVLRKCSCKPAPGVAPDLQRTAWRRLSSQSSRLCPGSELDGSSQVSPIRLHRRGPRPTVESRWFPEETSTLGAHVLGSCRGG